jgi:hypothetical protein
MRPMLLGFALCGILLAGCSSHGTLGIIANPVVDAGALLKAGKSYKELGYVEGQKCRHFILAIIPFGDGDLAHAVYDALAQRGGAMQCLMRMSKPACMAFFQFIMSIHLPAPRSRESLLSSIRIMGPKQSPYSERNSNFLVIAYANMRCT